AAGSDLSDDWRGIEIAHRHETGVGDRVRTLHEMKSYRLEKVVPGNFLGAGDVLLEEPSQVGVAHNLGRLSHAGGIWKELSFAGIVLVHPAQDVAQRGGSLARLAHLQVEQDA